MKLLHFSQLLSLIVFADFTEELDLSGKLEGGNEILIESDTFYKYMASLHCNETLKCSATVISLRHLLTAASCVKIFSLSEDPILFRSYYALVASTNDTLAIHPYYFRQVEVHPEYNLDTRMPSYNIAVITLLIQIYFIGKFVPLTWPDKNLGLNKTPFVPGWIMSFPQNCTDHQTRYLELKYIHIKINNMNKVKMQTYPNHTFAIKNLFSGTSAHDEYVEETDVGSPVFRRPPLKIIGILSHVESDKTLPAVYAKLQNIVPWIKNAMADKQFKPYDRKLFIEPELDQRVHKKPRSSSDDFNL